MATITMDGLYELQEKGKVQDPWDKYNGPPVKTTF